MQRSILVLLGFFGLIHTSAPAQTSGARFPLNVVASTIVGEEAEFGSIVAATVGPSGVVYAVDYLRCTVSAFSPEGRMLWKVGRKGQGPGEYQMPYRIAAVTDGTLLVFDLGTGEVTTLAQDGRYLGRTGLPLHFPYVNDIVATPRELLVSGYTSTAGQRRLHGVHRFRRSAAGLAYAGSFGPLPTVRDTLVRRYWGAGDITRGRNGDLIYALNLPYVIYRYDSAGRQKAVSRSPVRVRGTPDDAFKIERNGRALSITDSETPPDRLAMAVETANGLVLVARVTPRRRYWDLFTPAGAYVGSREVPREWGVAIGFDASRNLLWTVATHDDTPVLVRLQIAPGAPTPTTPARRTR